MGMEPYRFPYPQRRATLTVFSSEPSAMAHLRDHLLTAPECNAWGLVLPGLFSLVDLDDSNARWRCWNRLEQKDDTTAQSLYDAYSMAIQAELQEAHRLGWVVRVGLVDAAIGTSGLIVIASFEGESGWVRTAFLGGQGSPEAVRHAKSMPRGATGLIRESSKPMRSALHPKEFRAHKARHGNWTTEQRLFYMVFRPAVQFIRAVNRSISYSRGISSQPSEVKEYAMLRDKLPNMSQLSFQRWQTLRRTRTSNQVRAFSPNGIPSSSRG